MNNTGLSDVYFKINGSHKHLIVHYTYFSQKDVTITKIHELGHPEPLDLTDEQKEALRFICQEAHPEHIASEAEYLCDTITPK